MKKITMLVAGLGIAATALPASASAQTARSVINNHARADTQITQGIRQGRIDRQEARALQQQSNQIRQLRVRYERSRPGLTRQELRDLDQRITRLSYNIRVAMQDNRRPGYRR
jgi:Spy/CpxP family protein refolding chaperone